VPGLDSAENLIHLFQNTELPEQHIILAAYIETLGFVASFSTMPLLTQRVSTENKLFLCRTIYFLVRSGYTMDVTPREKYYSKQGFIQIFLTVENTGNE